MEKYQIIVFFFIMSTTLASPPSVTKRYRKDYEYNRKTDAFYKLHIESLRHWGVKHVCKSEGAEVMVPESEHDIIQLHSMIKKYPDLENYVWVGNDGQKHESAEEQPIIDLSSSVEMEEHGCEVLSRTGEVETMPCYRQLPFICKVAAKNAPYDKNCEVYGTGYRYYPSVGSCYKIPGVAFTWSQSYSECQAEGAHLLVINSQAESAAIHNFTNSVPSVFGSAAFYFFFAGFRAEKPSREFKTIFNQTLEEAGFSEWSEHEPNNSGGDEYCGCVFLNNGKLNDVNCSHSYGFICEKEVPSPS